MEANRIVHKIVIKRDAMRRNPVQVGCERSTSQEAESVAAHLIGDQQHHIPRLSDGWARVV
jgi:hypothetical protein